MQKAPVNRNPDASRLTANCTFLSRLLINRYVAAFKTHTAFDSVYLSVRAQATLEDRTPRFIANASHDAAKYDVLSRMRTDPLPNGILTTLCFSRKRNKIIVILKIERLFNQAFLLIPLAARNLITFSGND